MKTILITIIQITFSLFYYAYAQCNCDFEIDVSTTYQLYPEDLPGVGPGSIICLTGDRTVPLHFLNIEGSAENPILIKNCGKQVVLSNIKFENCKYIKLSGAGEPSISHGIKAGGPPWGLGVSIDGLSSDFEVEFMEIGGDGSVVGIVAKKDFGGNPPVPYPVFENLIVHDIIIDNIPSGCGMYIGETKSPGMQFKHVRIYNNTVTNIGREPIQIAHTIEDVEVYNNICYNSGMSQLYAQGNNFQVGDDSHGWFYNNVMLKGYEHGIICLANKDLHFFKNYIDDNVGMFFDDRDEPVRPANIEFHHNYIRRINENPVIKIYNEKVHFYIHDNYWLGQGDFYSFCCGVTTDSLSIENNVVKDLGLIEYDANFKITGTYADLGLGPIEGLGHVLNYNNERNLAIVPVKDTYIPDNTEVDLIISAANMTEKPITFSVTDLPSFGQFIDNGNGTAKFTFFVADASQISADEYTITVTANELNGQTTSKQFKVTTGLNTKIENVTKNKFKIYPNPSSGYVRINAEKMDELQIVNVSGKVVLSRNNIKQETTIEHNLKPGIYFIQCIKNNEIIESSKIIVE